MQARDINFNLHGYMVLELLGSGAMGDVFKCIDRSTGQLVAIKWLHRLEMAKRFANEADTLGRISHPNIAQFIDYIHTQDYAFIVMEYVEGLTIEKLIKHSGKLPETYALKIMKQLANGIKYLHNLEIVHRDLKAANIKVLPSSTVKLLDFGIAKTKFSDKLTAEGLVVGSMPYIAPEQFDGITTPKVDLWSLGVLYYQMLTRYLPFSGSNDQALRQAIKKGKYLSPEVFHDNISKKSKAIIANLLSPDPQSRWNIDELINFIEKQDSKIKRKSLAYTIRSWVGNK